MEDYAQTAKLEQTRIKVEPEDLADLHGGAYARPFKVSISTIFFR